MPGIRFPAIQRESIKLFPYREEGMTQDTQVREQQGWGQRRVILGLRHLTVCCPRDPDGPEYLSSLFQESQEQTCRSQLLLLACRNWRHVLSANQMLGLCQVHNKDKLISEEINTKDLMLTDYLLPKGFGAITLRASKFSSIQSLRRV